MDEKYQAVDALRSGNGCSKTSELHVSYCGGELYECCMNCVLWVLALRISLQRSKRAQVQHCTTDLCTKLWPENYNFVAKVGVPRLILDTGILTHYIASEQRIIVRTMLVLYS